MRSEVTVKKTGRTTTENRYYLSSQNPDDHTPAQWQQLVRGHWGGVEIRNHWRRDAIWGEDASRTRNPSALANLALLRNALFAVLAPHFPNQSHPEIRELLSSHPAVALRALRSR